MRTAVQDQSLGKPEQKHVGSVSGAEHRTQENQKGSKQKMNLTTWALLVLSVMNVAVAVLNLISIRQIEQTADIIDNITEKVVANIRRLDAQDNAIRELDERIDGETDTICRMIDDHRKLKNYAERTHLIALYAYNAEKKREIRWKNCRKHMQEAEERQDAENESDA